MFFKVSKEMNQEYNSRKEGIPVFIYSIYYLQDEA